MAQRTPDSRARINPRDYQRLMTLCVAIQLGEVTETKKTRPPNPDITGLSLSLPNYLMATIL